MKTYTINEGCHYSQHLLRLTYNRRILISKVMFHSDCWFPLILPDDYAINKLIGWSRGHHHTCSVRCGWRPAAISGYIDLFLYVYSKGHRHEKFFMTVECNKEFKLIMLISSKGHITFSALGKYLTLQEIDLNIKPGYILFPYFGGNNVAPHDINIDLQIDV